MLYCIVGGDVIYLPIACVCDVWYDDVCMAENEEVWDAIGI